MVSASEGIRLEVRFDDRLLTVLSQPAGDRHDAAVRWRQLVDLVARAGPEQREPGRRAGARYDPRRSTRTSTRICAPRPPAPSPALPLPLGLLEYFVSERLAVSAPVLAAATLDAGQWRALLAACRRRDAPVYRDPSSRRLRPSAASNQRLLAAPTEPDRSDAVSEALPRPSARARR